MRNAIRSLTILAAIGTALHAAPFLAMGDSAELFLTGTLGVRRAPLERYVAGRGSWTVSVGGHDVDVKWGAWGEGVILAPEFEQAARVAEAAGVPLRDVIQEAVEKARLQLGKGGAP